MTHAATGAHTATTENAAAAATATVTFEHYPLYCYHLSPTITQWCPLRARDIHELAQRRGFEGQDDTFFHLNHPIRWVRVVGVVVAVDQYYGRRVYTVDDGSGACIECVTTVPTTTTNMTKKPEEEATPAALPKPEDPYADVDVGFVVEARGGLALYRQQKQIRVTRLRRLASTAAEVAFWHKIRAFAADVLARPWVVDARQRRRLEKEARRDVVSGGGGGGPRRRHHRGHDDEDEEARAARKRSRHHREEKKEEEEAATAAPGDRREPETRQRRKERRARDEETSQGIPSRSGNSLDEARQRRKERHARDETASSHGHPPRSGNSLLDEARRRRREKAEKLREASKSEPSAGKYNALGL